MWAQGWDWDGECKGRSPLEVRKPHHGHVVIAGSENRRSLHQGTLSKESLSLFFLLPLGDGQRTHLLWGTEPKDKGDRRAGPGMEQEVTTEDRDPATGA